jgi:predicted phage tail protein
MKTIKQIADEIGVSKQAVHQKMRRQPLAVNLPPFTSIIDGTIRISDEGIALIKSAFNERNTSRQQAPLKPSTVDALLALVKEQQQIIKELTSANRELTAAIEHTTASLHAAQALHAGTMQKQLTDSVADPPEPVALSRGFFGRIFGRKKAAPVNKE